MRTNEFAEEQIMGILRGAGKGEQTLDALGRARGFTVQAYFRWRKKCGGIEV